jgi:hypothetical protein
MRFRGVRNSGDLSVFLAFLGPYVTYEPWREHTLAGSRNPFVWAPPGDTVFSRLLWGHIRRFSPVFDTPLASLERLAKGVATGSRLSSIAHILPTGSFSGQRMITMWVKHLGFAAVVGGSVVILSGCQTTAQQAPPPCLTTAPSLPPAPAFSPPALQQYSGPQPPTSGPIIETQPPPLAIPKKVSAPNSKQADPPKLERIA